MRTCVATRRPGLKTEPSQPGLIAVTEIYEDGGEDVGIQLL